MTLTKLRDLLKDPVAYAKELYDSMSQLRYTDSMGSDVWDLWTELPLEERDSFVDAVCIMVIDPVRQLITEYDERIMLLKNEIGKKRPSEASGGKELCYYCGQKYAIDNHACGDCLNG